MRNDSRAVVRNSGRVMIINFGGLCLPAGMKQRAS